MSTYGPTKQFDRIDRICVDRYGSSENDVVMFVIEQNPGIEEYGILLPMGISINLPDRPNTASTNTLRQQIFLWT